jgi:predicted transposase/invertase (TIGR01784 family)
MKALEEKDERFWRAYTALAEYNYTPEELLDYERYAMKQDEIATSLSDAEKKGELKGKRETAMNAVAMGLSNDQIIKLTNLSIEEIESLRNKR